MSGSEKRVPVRDKILATAGALFARDGVRAVGIDTIIAESGVAKMSLYRNFASKDELIAAWLEERNGAFWARWNRAMAVHPGAPRAQLEAILDTVAARVAEPDWPGCPFLNTHVAFPGAEHRAIAVIHTHKRAVHAKLLELAESAGAMAPAVLADQLQMLIDGAYVVGKALGPTGPVRSLAAAGRVLIAAQLPTDSA